MQHAFKEEIAKIIIERQYALPNETDAEVAEFASGLVGRTLTPGYIARIRREVRRGEWPVLVARYRKLGWMQ